MGTQMLHRHKWFLLFEKLGRRSTSNEAKNLSSLAKGGSSAASAFRQSTHMFWLVAAALTVATSTGPVQAGTCSTNFRELGGVADFPVVRSYVCTIGDNVAQPSLRVTFMRLNEPLAGSLAKREPIPELNQVFGETNVIANEVFKELEALFKEFGHKDVMNAESIEFALAVKAQTTNGAWEWRGIRLPGIVRSNSEIRRIWSLSKNITVTEFSDTSAISLPSANSAFFRTVNWPANFKQTYFCDQDPIECTQIWRYLNLAELGQIEKDTTSELQIITRDYFQDVVKEYAKRKSVAGSTTDATMTESTNWPDKMITYQKDFALYRYLGRSAWPEGFLIASGRLDECGAAIRFAYHNRPLALEVAVIENIHSDKIMINDFMGTKISDKKLRVSSLPNLPAFPLPLGQPEQALSPGIKIIVPLRIIFQDSVAQWRTLENLAQANSMYKKIQSNPRSILTSILQTGPGTKVTVAKRRASFLPPEIPADTEYTFGPELIMSGLLLGDDKLPLHQQVVNFVALSDANITMRADDPIPSNITDNPIRIPDPELRLTQNPTPAASCPILYSWNEREQAWVNHGKVIHNANAPAKEETSVVAVSPKTTRIRLNEEEPEVSYIRHVQMVYTLKDGRRIEINPVQGPASKRSARVIIPAYTSVEFQFKIPSGISPADIDRAEVAVTGYYLRYSTMKMSNSLIGIKPKK
jgi:hypothetical protein